MKFYLTYFFLLLFIPVAESQSIETTSAEADFDEGEYFFNRGEYEEAVYYYNRILQIYPDNANFNFKAGECYLNIPGKEALAVPYFEKAARNITEKNKYKKNSFEEKRAPLHAYFYLGNAYRYSGQLNKALEAYKTFVNSPLYADNYNVSIVENEIKACERAKIIEDNPILFDEVDLGEMINTTASENYPVVSGDEKTLVFVRKLKFYDAIFYSQWNGTEWGDPVNINPRIASDGDFYPTSLSFKGDELYLVRTINGSKDIYVSKLSEGVWGKAEKLDKAVNSLSNESCASISEDGNTLYFSSDRAGGRGGYDIYVSKKEGGSWGKAKNLGKTINTPFDETSPGIINQGTMLFFCSKGHYNMGGFDIFYSVFENKKWSLPVNIGSPVNTTGDETFFQPVKGNAGYLSKISENTGSYDISKVIIRSYIPKF